MNKLLAASFFVVLVFCWALRADADIPTLSVSGSLTATGTSTVLNLSGQSTCAIVVSGSGTGIVLVPQASSDNAATFATVSAIGSGSITANGTYVGNIATSGLTNFRFNLTGLASGTLNYVLTCSPSFGVGSLANNSVPAQNSSGATVPVICDNSAAFHITTVTTTLLVAAIASKKVYICSFLATLSAGTGGPGFKIEYGTQTTTPCDTGANGFTGLQQPTVGTPVAMPSAMAMFNTPASQQLCILTSGTTITVDGYVSYAQF